MMPANKQQNHPRSHVGLVLALAGLISAATLATGPIRSASAQADAWSWSYTGSLNAPRYFHTATLLPDGKVLVAGGANVSGGHDSAELYDPVTGKWNAAGSLTGPRIAHTATLLKDGKVLIVGGFDGRSFGPSLDSTELYDPKEGKWSATGSLNTPRFLHTATLLENGKVLVAGGSPTTDWDSLIALDTAELYDPDTGTWSFTGNLNTAVESHSATLLQNGKVLVLWGDSNAELYDPGTGTWSNVGSLAGVIGFHHTATLLPDGRVLIVGGLSTGFPNLAQLYDPGTAASSSTGRLKRARYDHTATRLSDGKVLVAGGVRYRASGGVIVANSELYDPDTGTWSLTSSLNTPRSDHTATLLPNGKALIVGGRDGSNIGGLSSVELSYIVTPAIIEVSVARKRLIVTGENFDTGAVILINGEEQKTTSDGQNPRTSLIGKKAGTKIKPGDRVQVRNPNGTVSQEFTFTG